MKKKIICIGIISMFLLTTLNTASATTKTSNDPMPDLEGNVTVSKYDDEEPGQAYTASVYIGNRGNGDAIFEEDEIWWRLEIFDQKTDKIFKSIEYGRYITFKAWGGPGPKDGLIHNYYFDPTMTGDDGKDFSIKGKSIRVIIDPYNVVAESNEENNEGADKFATSFSKAINPILSNLLARLSNNLLLQRLLKN